MKVNSSQVYIFILLSSVLLFISCSHNPSLVKDSKDSDRVSFKGTATYMFEGPLTLTGILNKPKGKGPFPAVVLLHGCGGIQPKRDHRWAERLSAWGYVTLQVDSFSPRGLSGVCAYSGYDAISIVQKRVTDAYDAKRYLDGVPFVDRNRIAVMGWSHGGLTTLQTLYQEKERPFRAAVALYPSCRRALTGLNAPLMILIGESDDWTPASQCVLMMPKDKTAPEVILKVYPGAFHGFDTLGANSNLRGSDGIHHIQYQPEAEADSIVQVKNFFKRYLK